VSVFEENKRTTEFHVHPSLFAQGISSLHARLQSLRDNNASLIAHSGVFDTLNHILSGRYGSLVQASIYPTLQEIADKFCSDVLLLKEFLQENSDYILILSSDHGDDMNSPILHGPSGNGNDGYLIFYNSNWKQVETGRREKEGRGEEKRKKLIFTF
jgi:hypothetical protein